MKVERVHLDDGGFDELYDALVNDPGSRFETELSAGPGDHNRPIDACVVVLRDGDRAITIRPVADELVLERGDAITERLEGDQ